MLINLKTAYYNLGEVIQDHIKIYKNCLKTNFFTSIASIISLIVMYNISNQPGEITWKTKLILLIFMVRFKDISRI